MQKEVYNQMENKENRPPTGALIDVCEKTMTSFISNPFYPQSSLSQLFQDSMFPLDIASTVYSSSGRLDGKKTPKDNFKEKPKRMSLGRRVSFAENLTIHEFPRDDDYNSPPEGKEGEQYSPCVF